MKPGRHKQSAMQHDMHSTGDCRCLRYAVTSSNTKHCQCQHVSMHGKPCIVTIYNSLQQVLECSVTKRDVLMLTCESNVTYLGGLLSVSNKLSTPLPVTLQTCKQKEEQGSLDKRCSVDKELCCMYSIKATNKHLQARRLSRRACFGRAAVHDCARVVHERCLTALV
jgi:hypothetical protein